MRIFIRLTFRFLLRGEKPTIVSIKVPRTKPGEKKTLSQLKRTFTGMSKPPNKEKDATVRILRQQQKIHTKKGSKRDDLLRRKVETN